MSEKKTPPKEIVRNAKLESSGHVLQGLFEDGKSPLSKPFLRWKLWRVWPEVVGETVSQICEPVSYDRGMIWIWVKNSTWMQQLMYLKPDYIRKINHWANQEFVHDIRFTLNRREIPEDMYERNQLQNSVDSIENL